MDDALAAEGPSFPLLVKLLATGLMLALAFWGWQAFGTLARAELDWRVYGMVLIATVFVVASYVVVLRSRTTISATHIRQHGLWSKQVALADISHAKLIDLPGLRWLIAPRLVVRVKGWGSYTFFVAEPAVLTSIRELGLGRLPAQRFS